MGWTLFQDDQSRDEKSNFFIRMSVSLISLGIHLSIFWPVFPVPLIAFIAFQALIYPFLMFALCRKGLKSVVALQCDTAFYGFCQGLWGLHPFLIAAYWASGNIINTAAGGIKNCVKGTVLFFLFAAAASAISGFQIRTDIPYLTVVIASFGLLLFTAIIGYRVFNINSRLRNVRKSLESKQDELMNTASLALAVNAHLDINILMEKVMNTFEKLFPFETLYMLTFNDDRSRLEVAGVYGSIISDEEHKAFLKFQFDADKDKDSMFIKCLQKRKVAHIPVMTPELSKVASKIDQDLYAIKPSISLVYFPVYVNDEVIAGACFINYENHFNLTEIQINKIQGYLIQVGTAVRNAALFKELVTAKEQAESAKAKAEASEEAKSRFLANMSHEIRTPMTAILGFADSLQEEDLSQDDRATFVGHIIRSGQHLLSMINDILDISKIEASKIEIERIDCNLTEVLCDIESYMQIKTKDKNLAFNLNLFYPIPNIFIGDPTRLKQILLNLCNNAVKFTNSGSIDVSVRFDGLQTMEFCIIDTGIGIDENEKNKIFSAFDQADTSTTRLYGGTGLGLYISKNLAQLMGGNLYLESEKNVGSTFTLTVPISGQSNHFLNSEEDFLSCLNAIRQSKTLAIVPETHGHVLLAEDVEENQKIIGRYLQQMGLTVDIVCNGKKAVEAAMSNAYDLILMDIQMPIMDGVEAMGTLQKCGNITPIIACTANVMKHQREQYLALGAMDILEKPIEKNHIYSKVVNALNTKASNNDSRALIVEDNEVNQLIIQRFIEKASPTTQITCVTNGQLALECAETQDFDLIFMDLNMPVMGGIEATQNLRANHCRAPVYIVSGDVSNEDVKKSKEAGATGHLAKPIDKQLINAIIQRYLPAPPPNFSEASNQ